MSECRVNRMGPTTRELVSWMLLLAGLAIWAAAVLVPTHVELTRLESRRDIMQQQSEHLSAQVDRYQTFEHAVVDAEPAVVELLASKHLNLQPVGKTPVDATGELTSRPEIALAGMGDPHWQTQAQPMDSASVDDWVYQSMPSFDASAMAMQPVEQSRLARLTRGYNRLILALAGGLLLVAGLWPTPVTQRSSSFNR